MNGSTASSYADCPDALYHGNPFRYCPCGWTEAAAAPCGAHLGVELLGVPLTCGLYQGHTTPHEAKVTWENPGASPQ